MEINMAIALATRRDSSEDARHRHGQAKESSVPGAHHHRAYSVTDPVAHHTKPDTESHHHRPTHTVTPRAMSEVAAP